MNTIIEIEGTKHRYWFPTAVDQLTFEAFCEFRQDDHKFLNAEDDLAGGLEAMMDAIRHLTKGPVEQLPYDIEGDQMSDLIKGGYQIEIGDEISIRRVYAHLVVLIQQYTPTQIPKSYKMRWGKMDFDVQREETAKILAGFALTTGEAIEVLELQRRASKRMETNPKDVGSIDFNLGLREFAILVRRKGERLPSRKKDRDQMIAQRIKLFKKLPLNHVLDLRFFFAASWMQYITTAQIGSFGTVPQVQKVPLKQKLIDSAKKLLKKPGQLWDGGHFMRKG